MITNEPGQHVSVDQFQTSLNQLITHDRERTHPPSILLIAPLQDIVMGQSRYYTVIRQVAATRNTAFLDMRGRWGTQVITGFFGPDLVHENGAGNREMVYALNPLLAPTQANSVFPTPPPSPSAPRTR